MPHDDFFEATLIEFTQWIEGKEKTLVKFEKFETFFFYCEIIAYKPFGFGVINLLT